MQFSMNVILNKYEDFSKKKEENEIRKTTKMYSRNKMKKKKKAYGIFIERMSSKKKFKIGIKIEDSNKRKS
jgi:hypothetical protein